MLLVDHEAGVIVEANPAAARFYGYAPEAMPGLQVTALSPDAPKRLHQVATTPSGALSFAVEHRLASGELRQVEIGSAMVQVDGRRLVYAVIRPAAEVATERAMADLRRSESRYRELVQRLGAGVVLLDTAGVPTWLNETMAAMLGYLPEALLALGTSVVVGCAPEIWDERLLGELARTGSAREDVKFRHHDGHTVVGEVRARRLPDGMIEGSSTT